MNKGRKKRKSKIPAFLIVCAVLFFLIRLSLYDGLTVKRYTVDSPYSKEEHTYVLLTDLHSTYYGEDQGTILEKIHRISPEAVFFSGDIADDKRDFRGTQVLLENLSASYDCYYVTGNHECWLEYADDIKLLVEECGVKAISNQCVKLGDGIRLFGVDDPLFYSDGGFEDALDSFDTGGEYFDILLSHRPEYAEKYAEHGYELTLAGHAHGGQVRLPLLMNGLFAPNQGYFPDYAGGMYTFKTEQEKSTMIVSRGLMIDELPRVFNPPEIVVITVK